jgi:hypothetical protein
MREYYNNSLGSERSVESEFVIEMLYRHCLAGSWVLDVGGIPSFPEKNKNIIDAILSIGPNYRICDFRGGNYVGDFVQISFDQKFDIIIFLSSLEHFPQCTEGDMVYREGEDRRGFLKALSLLNNRGKIVLTVPYGKQVWQPYHQNYDWNGIQSLIAGSFLKESYAYKLEGEIWRSADLKGMSDLRYTDRCYGVGCFLLEKPPS